MSAVLRDVAFSSRSGFRPLSLDLVVPDATGPVPVVVCLHGGGWRVGSRKMFVPGFEESAGRGRIVDAGFAVASIDYRLTGEAIFPAQLDDVRAALDWVRAHGAEHGIDATRIIVWGESAGGHLAALAGLDRQQGVRGAVCWYAPTDLLAFPKPGPDDERPTREESLVGGPVDEHVELATAASPARQAHADAPPFHIAHGADDEWVPPAQSELLADALRAAGAEVELTIVPGATHMWKGLDSLDTVLDPALDFARRVTG